MEDLLLEKRLDDARRDAYAESEEALLDHFPEDEVETVIHNAKEFSTALLPDGCFGCERAPEGFCRMYRGQEARQHTRLGGCAGRTHNKKLVDDMAKGGTVSFDPLKASKKAAKGLAIKAKAAKKTERRDAR